MGAEVHGFRNNCFDNFALSSNTKIVFFLKATKTKLKKADCL